MGRVEGKVALVTGAASFEDPEEASRVYDELQPVGHLGFQKTLPTASSTWPRMNQSS